jgi:hypothetical protein
VVTTWSAWRSEHRRTRVLPRPAQGPGGEPTDRDGYAPRNARRTFGLGLDVEGPAGTTSRLYPFGALPHDAVVEEEVGGVPVVVAADPGGGTAHAFDRRVGGRTLSFERDTAGTPPRPVLRERGGRRAWALRSGLPLGDGSEPLRRLLASPWETDAWRAQHPAGTRYAGPPAQGPVPR